MIMEKRTADVSESDVATLVIQLPNSMNVSLSDEIRHLCLAAVVLVKTQHHSKLKLFSPHLPLRTEDHLPLEIQVLLRLVVEQ